MSYEQYAVTITTTDESYRWDFSNTDLRRRSYSHGWEVQTPSGDRYNLTFHAKAFEPLRQADLEAWETLGSYSMSVTRCGWIAGRERCLPVANVYDFSWTPKDETNLSKGLYWRSDGEPNEVGVGEWEDWETEFEFECVPNNDSVLPNLIWDRNEDNPQLILKWTNDLSCPQKGAPKVTPTPGPWTPSCNAEFRQTGQPDWGFAVNLSELNNGRFGHGQTITVADGDWRFLLFSPCERMIACPWGATCDTTDMTSVWLCGFDSSQDDAALTTCLAYGVVPENSAFSLNVKGSISSGLAYDLLPQNGRNTHVSLTCDRTFPSGHISIRPMDSHLTNDGKQLNIVAHTNAVCDRYLPTPVPLKGQCEIDTFQGAPNSWELDLDLTKYSVTVSNTTVLRRDQNRSYQLLFLPCDAMPCPDGYDCNGDEDATIWLCERWTTQHEPICTGFGLHKYNMTVTLRGGYIFGGVDVRYQGDNHLDAHVYFKCLETLPLDTLAVQQWVAVDDNHLYFEADVRRACPVGQPPTPEPPLRYIPVKPPVIASPTPIPSPNPHHILINNTHFVILDLVRAQETYPLRLEQAVNYGRYWGVVYTEWNSWNTLTCPNGWTCPDGPTSRANLWQCWLDNDFVAYCHGVANKHKPGTYITSNHAWHLDTGLTLHYAGDFGTYLRLKVDCDQRLPRGMIPISMSDIYYRNNDNVQGDWMMNSTSGSTCPQAIETGTVPTVRRPAAPATATQQSSIGEFVAGQHVGLNLKKFAYLQGEVIVGDDVHYHRAEFHYSPWDFIGCPDGKACGVYQTEQANAWKCVGTTLAQCFPVGDKRYGLTMGHISKSDPLSGITAAYLGGPDNYSIQFDFQCNLSVPFGEVWFSRVGVQKQDHSITIWSHTHEVCPDREWGQIMGGSIFLIVVIVLFTAYFAIGTLVMYVLTGTVTLPNEGFWSEFAAALAAAVGFVVSCGKGPVTASGASYDNI